MASLIDQLQEEALDPSTAITDLLRKAKVVAAKLDLRDAAVWIAHELEGYPPGSEIPKYRTIVGDPRYLNLFHGWMQILIAEQSLQETLSVRTLPNPVSELEALAKGQGELQLPYPPGIIASLEQLGGRNIQTAGLWFSRSVITSLLDAVRTRVLDWAVELEKAGVRGEGRLSFSKRDREVAAGVTYNINVGGSVTGNVGGVSGHATVNATHIGPETVQALSQLADSIQQSAGQMGLPAAAKGQLERDAAELKAEISRPVPDASKLGKVLASIKSVAENAAGSLAASGVLYVLARPEVAALIQRVLP